MKPLAFDKKSIAFDTKYNEHYRKPIRHHQEIVVKSLDFDKKSVAFDTKSDGNCKKKSARIHWVRREGRYEIKWNYRKSTRHHQEIAMKSIAFDTKSNGNDRRSTRNQ